jgi:hypothetical protein
VSFVVKKLLVISYSYLLTKKNITGITSSESKAETKIPKIKLHANSKNILSSIITNAPNMAAQAVRDIGLKRFAPVSISISESVTSVIRVKSNTKESCCSNAIWLKCKRHWFI